MTSSNNTTMDEAFHRRIQGAIQTVQAWDDDPLLLAECRAIIPWEKLRRDDESGDYAQPEKDDKTMLSRDARFVQRLTRFFKSDMMTWLNNPDCAKCHGKNTVHKETRGPLTVEEREGQASRVEVYTCNDCGGDGTTETETTTTTFARCNSPRKLLETRRGRCGEYANLFGLFCRAVGLETRYILDLTDHGTFTTTTTTTTKYILVQSLVYNGSLMSIPCYCCFFEYTHTRQSGPKSC
jgi:Transglutaminase-like superfamily